MRNEEIMRYVDHTLLSPIASYEDIDKLIGEYKEYNAKSICIPPSYIKYVNEKYKNDNINIGTVIGFPLGYQTKETKVFEARKAITYGAKEIDMVINITDVKNKKYGEIIKEIDEVKDVISDNILKVIIETCYLNNDEKIKLCEIVSKSKAEYIKTSTGFGTGGANFDDIKLFNKYLFNGKKIKASGGIKTKDDMINYIELGCERLGTSSAVNILFNK